MLSILLTAVVGVHCTGAGLAFAFLWGSEKIVGGMGSAFGYPSRRTTTLQKVGLAAVWEVPLAMVVVDRLNQK